MANKPLKLMFFRRENASRRRNAKKLKLFFKKVLTND